MLNYLLKNGSTRSLEENMLIKMEAFHVVGFRSYIVQ